MANETQSCEVAILGAGPYGLAAAAFLRAAGVETAVFGEPMEFWAKRMPRGMLLRSSWSASHLADPAGALSLDAYEKASGRAVPRPIPLETFVAYGRWFQERAAPGVERRRVARVEHRPGGGFRLCFEEGPPVTARRVVVAAGIGSFARRLPLFDCLPGELASHASDHESFAPFAGRRVAVIGSGQSALESAALLKEAGAEAEVISRAPIIHWLDQRARWLKSPRNPLRPLFYPPTDVGPPILNWIVALPGLFRCFPQGMQEPIAYRSIRPAGSGWLIPRLKGVPLTLSRTVVAAAPCAGGLELRLDDGASRRVDHVLQAIGYRVDVRRYPFLPRELLGGIRMQDGYPLLKRGFESSVPGLHFVGAPAAVSFGPLFRFVAGTPWMGRALCAAITGRSVSKSRIGGGKK